MLITVILGVSMLCHAEPEKQNVLIIIAHPNPESFNHAIFEVVREKLEGIGHHVKVKDLYAENFEPVLSLEEWKRYESQTGQTPPDVQLEQESILWANHLVFIYPTWWWAPPAILKGYLDRVFTPVFAFEVNVDQVRGQLSGKKVTVIQTTGAEEEFIQQNGMDESVKKLMGLGIFEFCGMEVLHHEFLMGIAVKSYAELKNVLEEVDILIGSLF